MICSVLVPRSWLLLTAQHLRRVLVQDPCCSETILLPGYSSWHLTPPGTRPRLPHGLTWHLVLPVLVPLPLGLYPSPVGRTRRMRPWLSSHWP